jgi:hypothetical protein
LSRIHLVPPQLRLRQDCLLKRERDLQAAQEAGVKKIAFYREKDVSL